MEPEKDFDYDQFCEFMRHLSGLGQAVHLDQQARTYDELRRLDSLEVAVSSRPCYDSAQQMLESIKEL